MASRKMAMRTDSLVENYDITWEIHNFSKHHDGVQSAVFTPSSTTPVEFVIEIKFTDTPINSYGWRVTEFKIFLRRHTAELISKTFRVQCTIIQLFKSNGKPLPDEETNCSKMINENNRESYTLYNNDNILLTTVSTNSKYQGLYHGFLGLDDDILVVKACFELFGHCVATTSSVRPQVKMSSNKLLNLTSDFKTLYNSKIFSDMTVRIGSNVFQAHQAVLAARSPVFKSMMENHCKESKLKCITITDVDSDVFESFLKYLYSGDIEDKSYSAARHLYAVADKYAVSSLQEECGEILTSTLTLESVCEVLELAYLHSDAFLKKEAINFITVRFAEVKQRSEWCEIMKDYPELASEVLGSVTFGFGTSK